MLLWTLPLWSTVSIVVLYLVLITDCADAWATNLLDFWATRRLRLQEWLSVVRRGGRAGCSPRLALCNRLSWTVCKMGYLSNVRNLSYPTLGIRQWFPIRLSYSMLYIFLVLICVTRLCIVPRHVTARYKSSFYYDYYYYYYYPVLVSGTLVSY